MKKTQHEKIIEYCKNREWVCGNEFRTTLYIFSPHKRRAEIENGEAKGVRAGRYTFDERPCAHDYKNVKDYKMVENSPIQEPLLQQP